MPCDDVRDVNQGTELSNVVTGIRQAFRRERRIFGRKRESVFAIPTRKMQQKLGPARGSICEIISEILW
jgi:predicted RNase H-like nuclease